PTARACCSARRATDAESDCNPWSITNARTRSCDLAATCTAAAVSANESAPPETATHNSPVAVYGTHRGSAKSSRTARRTSATATSGPLTEPAHLATGNGTHPDEEHDATPRRCSRSTVHPTQPVPRVVELRPGRERVRRGPHRVETNHTDSVDDLASEPCTPLVLCDFRVHAEQTTQHPIHDPTTPAARGEPFPDRGHARHHIGSDRVHHIVRMSFQQCGQRDQPIENLALGRRLQQLHHPERGLVPLLAHPAER